MMRFLDNVEVNKSKKKGINVILNSESVAEEVISDSGSKKKGTNIILGSEYVSKEANAEDCDTEMVTLATESNKEKKKKRKRGEIEAGYEEKRYGVVAAVEKVEKGIAETVVGEKRKKMDNPEDMIVSKEGFDDESELLRTVIVRNLPLKIKKKVLLKEFGSFGEVESVTTRSIPVADSATPRKADIIKKKLNDDADSVHAYVVFKSVESAQASLAHNMAMVEGRHIGVDRACPPCKKMKGDIFVGNLPFSSPAKKFAVDSGGSYKGKAKTAGSYQGMKQTGAKRKMDDGTPVSASRNKKFRES